MIDADVSDTDADADTVSDVGETREAGRETVEVPAYYAAEIRRRERVARESPIDVYSSSVNEAWGWPWKLTASNERRQSTARSAGTVMVDPGLRNPACSPEIAHAAARVDADYVILKDISPEHRQHADLKERHLTSLKTSANCIDWFRELRAAAQEHERVSVGAWTVTHDAAPVVPLQPPYEETLAAAGEGHECRGGTVNLLDDDDIEYYAVGGLLSIDAVEERISALQYVRDELDDGVRLHALAPGTSPAMIRALRENADLVDSLDVSTPENAPGRGGKLPDVEWKQHKIRVSAGEDSSVTRAQYSAGIAVELARQLTPGKFDEQQDVHNRDDEQRGLGSF